MNGFVAVVTVILSFIALMLSLYTFKTQRLENSYSDIDGQYLNLLRLALDTPDLRNYEKTSRFHKIPVDDSFRSKYDIYAYMCWNLVETIFDRQKERHGRFRLSDTWVPVIIEENRLHYSWFKHNLRLFKPSFQRFVTGELNDIDVVEGKLADLDLIYERFERDFPQDERLDRSRIELLMSKGRYKLLLAKHRLFDVVIGYAFIYEPESPKMTWLDYMAIDAQFQNAGYGTLLFNKLAQHRDGDNIGVFLEVEPVSVEDDDAGQEQRRRIAFYERLGAKAAPVQYLLPTEKDGCPMHLYFRPSPGVHFLPKDQIQESIASAFDYIHGDKIHRDSLYKSFIHTVSDLTC